MEVRRQSRTTVYYLVVALLSVIPISTLIWSQTQGAFWPGVFADFSAYWLAVERWQHALSIYGSQGFGLPAELELSETFPYLYPPTLVLVFYLYQLFPFTVAATLWGVTTAGAFWLSIVVLLEEYTALTWPQRVGLIPVVFFFQPVWYAFRLGQITPLMAAAVGFSAVAMERSYRGGNHHLVGVGVTVAAVIKPLAAPAGAVLLSSRRRLLGAAMTAGVFYGLGIVVFGVQPHLTYIETLLTAKAGDPTTLHPIENFHAGWFEPFDVLGVWSWPLRGGLLAIVAGASLFRDGSRTADRAAMAAGCVVIPLTAPEGYSLSFVFYVPAAIILAAEQPRWVGGLLVALLASHAHAWVMRNLSEFGVTTTVAVVLQPGLYVGVGLLIASLSLLLACQRPPKRVLTRGLWA